MVIRSRDSEIRVADLQGAEVDSKPCRKYYGDDVYNVIARNRGAVQQIFYGRSKKISPSDIARSIDLYLDRKPALPPTDERQLELALPQPDDDFMIPAFLRRSWT